MHAGHDVPHGQDCGVAPDGCGGTVNCGTCTTPATCGGAGVHSQCGVPPTPDAGSDAGTPCVPATTCPAGITCGPAPDGCGGVIASCGTCVAPQTCGGGGVASQCGGTAQCVPTTTCPINQNCGVAPNGCGGSINCGTCTGTQTCGGGGVANQCGQPACVPESCTQLGYNCGTNSNGCGGTQSCGTCNSPQFCGGGGTSVCGPTTIMACDGGTPTSLTGYVFDPANNLPIDNALVYVPVGAVQTPQTGVNPAQCGCSSPPAYASAFTGVNGKFTLNDIPSGNITVVVQLGKWQRVFSETVTGCTANNLGGGTSGAAQNLTLPSNHTQGNIPLFAIDTGAVDSMECVLLKMGIAQSEFVNPVITGGHPTAPQRIHIYKGSIVNGGAIINNQTPTEASLTESSTVMDSYDVLLFPCQGNAGSYTGTNWPNTLGNLINYTTAGGRMFATHFHYDLLENNGAFANTATWANGNSYGNYYADPTYNSVINQTFARGATLASWLNQPIVYGGTLGQIPVGVIRNNFSGVNAPAELWMYTANGDQNVGGQGNGPGPNVPLHYTFDTPYVQGGADGTCGRVVYSDFHVESEVNGNGYNGTVFPGECQGLGPPVTMTPQEQLLEFMIFDLTLCVSQPTCTPVTCQQQGIQCGPAGNGCGGTIASCGTCAPPAICGGGGPGICGTGCTPLTACPTGQNCGIAPNGCGGSIACGQCTPPQTCGGGGVANQCGSPSCTPQGCPANQNCGQAPNGCGGLTASCGTCTPPEFCGGGGPGVCGIGDAGATCVPLTCQQQGVTCGPAGDGCGGVIASCGTCPGMNCPTPAETCGGGGTPGVCGSECHPTTCSALGLTCGPAGDGCGCTLNCGSCTPPQTCGGGGTPGVCGQPNCTAQTCQELGCNCGPQGDGCGGTLDCGTCPTGTTCGGGGTACVCGNGTPR